MFDDGVDEDSLFGDTLTSLVMAYLTGMVLHPVGDGVLGLTFRATPVGATETSGEMVLKVTTDMALPGGVVTSCVECITDNGGDPKSGARELDHRLDNLLVENPDLMLLNLGLEDDVLRGVFTALVREMPLQILHDFREYLQDPAVDHSGDPGEVVLRFLESQMGPLGGGPSGEPDWEGPEIDKRTGW